MTAVPLQPEPLPPGSLPSAELDPLVPSPLEATLEALLQSLLELGICASDVQSTALESHVGGAAGGYPGGLVGKKAAQTVEHLANLYDLKDSVGNVMIPMEVINSVDAGKNPHLFTRDMVERVAGENMYTNGILGAVTDYRDLLTAEMAEAFPELADMLAEQGAKEQAVLNPNANGNGHIEPSNGSLSMETDL